ncbi:glycosyltransferase [Shewanella algae]|uniref:glycosyltransferase n=1 Tax=Shewanella algae TaxID=38313 RepID=UPI0031F5D613
MTKLSIVTVCYNDLNGLKKTVNSVGFERKLCGDDVEYIIVDGFSTDGTKAYLDEVANSVSLIISEPDKGLYDAMNKGAKVANGKFILYMNAGDYFESGALVKVLENLKENKFYFFRSKIISEDSMLTWYFPNDSISSINIDSWLKRNGPNLQSCCFPYDFYKKNLFDANFKVSADMAYIGEALVQCSYQFVDLVCGNFFLGGVSNTYNKFSVVLIHAKEAVDVNRRYYSQGRSVLLESFFTYSRFITKYLVIKILGVRVLRSITRFKNRIFS